jgi:hypothetical protein
MKQKRREEKFKISKKKRKKVFFVSPEKKNETAVM